MTKGDERDRWFVVQVTSKGHPHSILCDKPFLHWNPIGSGLLVGPEVRYMRRASALAAIRVHNLGSSAKPIRESEMLRRLRDD